MKYQSVFLHPGELLIANEPNELITVLGSCVSVVLYDKIKKIGGMNHYIMPLWNGDELKSPKYGNIAVVKLIEKMIENGSKIKNLEAKLFGGAQMYGASSAFMIGYRNITVAKEILYKYNIPIIAQDTGGDKGRHIAMQSDTGKIFLTYHK